MTLFWKHPLLLKTKLIREYMIRESIWKNSTVEKLGQCILRQSLETEDMSEESHHEKGRGAQDVRK